MDTQRLLPTGAEIDAAKATIREALANLPDGISMTDVSRETKDAERDAFAVPPNILSVFRSTGNGISEPRLAQVEDALRTLGALPPISPSLD